MKKSMVLTLAIVAVGLIGLPDPVSEAHDAARHAATIPQPDVRYIRYLSIYNTPQDQRATAAKIMRFWCNSLSQRHRLAYPHEATDSLWWIDLRDFGWTTKQWGELAAKDVYFSVYYDRDLYALTGEYYPVMRWDYFLATTSADPTYGKFLGLPNTLKELKKDFFVQEEGVRKLSLAQGGSVLQSIVALHNRQLERWPTITGYFWQSRDVLNNQEQRNALEPDNLFAIKFDGAEFIWRLPNGMQAYFLANKDEKKVNVVPADIAIDTVSPFRDKQVRSARSCIACHGKGINPFDDVIERMIRTRNVNLKTLDKEIAEALEDFYLSDVGKQVKSDQLAYADAIQTVNRMLPDENAAEYAKAIAAYLDDNVTLNTAANELGVVPDWFEKLVQSSGTLAALRSGMSVPRDAFEDNYKSLLLLKYQLREQENK